MVTDTDAYQDGDDKEDKLPSSLTQSHNEFVVCVVMKA